jgi:hypothetical protein
MNHQTATSGHQVDTSLKAELEEILNTLTQMGDASNFAPPTTPSEGIEKVAARTGDMDAMFKDLRRTLPATYFRNNSRVKKVFDQILKAHQTNQEELFELRQPGSSNAGFASPGQYLEKLERTKRRLTELIDRL